MLEIRTYTLTEIAEALNMSPNRQSIIRKLERNNIEFQANGRGKNLTLEIKEIPSAFKIFCITELGFNPHSDFTKIRNLFYFFFNDEEFVTLPIEAKAERLRDCGKPISFSTISAYLDKLFSVDDSYLRESKYVYYFALDKERRSASREEYLSAWHEYWTWRGECDAYYATKKIKEKYKGFPRKTAVPELGAFPSETIIKLIELTNASYEEEYGKKF